MPLTLTRAIAILSRPTEIPRKLANRVRQHARRVRATRWSRLTDREVTVRTKHGLMTVRTGPDESISRSLYVSGENELAFTERLLAYLRAAGRLPERPAGTVLDIGANNGVTSVGMLHRGHFAHAVAVEPEPRNYALLRRNVSQNGLDARATTLNIAISDHDGGLTFELSDDNSGDHRVHPATPATAARFGEDARRTIMVPCRPLDAVVRDLPPSVRDHLSLVWIDVQGHETGVLRGGGEVWERRVPVVSELWPYGMARAGISEDAYCATVRQYWTRFAFERDGQFVERPITDIGARIDELGRTGRFTSIVLLA